MYSIISQTGRQLLASFTKSTSVNSSILHETDTRNKSGSWRDDVKKLFGDDAIMGDEELGHELCDSDGYCSLKLTTIGSKEEQNRLTALGMSIQYRNLAVRNALIDQGKVKEAQEEVGNAIARFNAITDFACEKVVASARKGLDVANEALSAAKNQAQASFDHAKGCQDELAEEIIQNRRQAMFMRDVKIIMASSISICFCAERYYYYNDQADNPNVGPLRFLGFEGIFMGLFLGMACATLYGVCINTNNVRGKLREEILGVIR